MAKAHQKPKALVGFSDFLDDSISRAQNRGVICAAQIDGMVAFLGPKLADPHQRSPVEAIMEVTEVEHGILKDIHPYILQKIV